jgi:hypothetical protein
MFPALLQNCQLRPVRYVGEKLLVTGILTLSIFQEILHKLEIKLIKRLQMVCELHYRNLNQNQKLFFKLKKKAEN